jgi:hypothetical protein
MRSGIEKKSNLIVFLQWGAFAAKFTGRQSRARRVYSPVTVQGVCPIRGAGTGPGRGQGSQLRMPGAL